MIPNSGTPLSLSFVPDHEGARSEANNLHLTSQNGFAFGTLNKNPQDVRITLRIKPHPGVSSFGICVRGEGEYERGCELRFEPEPRRVQYGSPINGGLAPNPTADGYGSDLEIGGVDRLEEPFEVDIIVRDDFVDTCIDQKRTVITKRTDRPSSRGSHFLLRGSRRRVLREHDDQAADIELLARHFSRALVTGGTLSRCTAVITS